MRTLTRVAAFRVFTVLLALLLSAPALKTAANPRPDADSARTLSPYFVVDKGDTGIDTLPLKSTEVDVKISGVIADVRVTQIYRNAGTQPIEARYVFPASTRAAVYALTMRIGDRVVAAQIREKQAARQEYEVAKREGKSAMLLEQHRPNVFQMSIAHVMPGDEIAVDLRYTETVVPTDAVYRFVFPTVVGPRYNGAPGRESHQAEGWIAQPTLRAGQPARQSFGFKVEINGPMPVQELRSPSHSLTASGVGGRTASAELAPSPAHADRDVVLEYRLAGKEIASGVLVHEGKDENFFLALIEPPARVPQTAIVPRDYVFVLDVSGSMHGFPIETAKTLMRGLVANLRPTDTFNIIPFAGGHSLFAPQSVTATRDNVDAAVRFINAQRGGGSTELLAALRKALAMESDADRARSFVVITDGYVTIEKEAMELVRANLGNANVFAFGIGSSVNRFLIEGLARAGRGEAFIVLDQKQAATEADRLRAYIEAPVLTHVRVTFNGVDAYDIDPPQVPDLFAQRPIVISGKFRGPPIGRIEVTGTTATGAFSKSLDLAANRPHQQQGTQALAQLWARSRIATLGDFQKLTNDSTAAKEITALGLKYSLLTDYTSFIAVDRIVRNPNGLLTSVDQPQPLPAGVSELAVGQVPSTPEPEFAALMALAGGLAWWMRRRRRVEPRHAH
ncbi:MAG: VIT domain-containing protein [Burkholderiaceae bacterium]